MRDFAGPWKIEVPLRKRKLIRLCLACAILKMNLGNGKGEFALYLDYPRMWLFLNCQKGYRNTAHLNKNNEEMKLVCMRQ